LFFLNISYFNWLVRNKIRVFGAYAAHKIFAPSKLQICDLIISLPCVLRNSGVKGKFFNPGVAQPKSLFCPIAFFFEKNLTPVFLHPISLRETVLRKPRGQSNRNLKLLETINPGVAQHTGESPQGEGANTAAQKGKPLLAMGQKE